MGEGKVTSGVEPVRLPRSAGGGLLVPFIDQEVTGGGESYTFTELSPFASLRFYCFLAQPWHASVEASGVFWLENEPNRCFELRIADGVATYRILGPWEAECDRRQCLRFENLGSRQPHIEEMLRRCLVSGQIETPNTSLTLRRLNREFN